MSDPDVKLDRELLEKHSYRIGELELTVNCLINDLITMARTIGYRPKIDIPYLYKKSKDDE